jgi:medium-chain acyl-[acyl-carrier-protein] hydrolase
MTVRSKHRGRVFVSPAHCNPSAWRLFCFPHAGGAASFFFDLARKLAPGVECACVQLPGRGARLGEAPHFSVADIANEVANALAPEMLDKPFAFYGHSFGGVVAFEVIKQLRRDGMPLPEHLFVGAAPPPRNQTHETPLHNLPDREFIDGVQARYAGIPSAVLAEPDILRLLLPAVRADLTAFETYLYQPGDALTCPITAFVGVDDPVAGVERSAGWRPHTSNRFETVVLPGDHFFLRLGSDRLARCLRERLVPSVDAEAGQAQRTSA